ncbi:hypothetical protein F0562_023995 [Nyssa sinensis]|uniref:Uncharacterized protein n=1 Tax=Nyssa sinensis TaxID=561372 RepID=A0A5J5BI34_9ASTE|nr:hypothetical protein F0562_023995 [Nyssa sinensis]
MAVQQAVDVCVSWCSGSKIAVQKWRLGVKGLELTAIGAVVAKLDAAVADNLDIEKGNCKQRLTTVQLVEGVDGSMVVAYTKNGDKLVRQVAKQQSSCPI